MKLTRTNLALGALLSLDAMSAQAAPVITKVNFDYNGGGFDITNIQTFDWQANASLVIEDAIISSSVPGATTLGGFFTGGGAVGQTVTFKIHSQSRLNDMVGGSPNAVLQGLDTDGSGANAGTWEVTQVIDATETATVIFPGVILFATISGTYSFYLDTNTPDSVNSSGVGFTDGTKFLWGNVTGTGGTFNGNAGQGSSFLEQSITGYDSNIIKSANPALSLVGTTFNSQVLLDFSAALSQKITVGSPVGEFGYAVKAPDLVLNSDSSTNFKGDIAVPEPATLFLLGGGLVGLLGFKRSRNKA